MRTIPQTLRRLRCGDSSFVDNMPNYRWDGWTVVHFTADPAAYYDKRGRFYNGRWGYETRYSFNSAGELERE